MREQGSLKGEGTHRGNLFVHNSEQNLPTCFCRYGCFCSLKGDGTHRGNLCVDTQIFPNPDKSIVIYHDSKECEINL